MAIALASFLIPCAATLPRPLSTTLDGASSFFRPPPTGIRFAVDRRRTSRGMTVVRRAGPSTSTYIYAFVFPLSLLAMTIFTSIRIADKLDRDYLEELAINEAIREAEEEEDEEDGEDGNVSVEKEPPPAREAEPALQRTRTRNRPKREA